VFSDQEIQRQSEIAMMRNVFSLVLVATISPGVLAEDRTTSPKVTAQILDQGTTSASSSLVLNLNEAIGIALAKNPAIQSASHTVSAERAKVPQASALPEPAVGVGWMGNPRPFSVQTGDPSSYRSVSAMQTLPFPGKRSLRGQVAGEEADASQWDMEGVRRRVVADVKAAYYDYWYYDKAIRTTQENRDLLTKLSQIAEARYRVGKGMQADVLRSQVEISLLLRS
jgi:outer membrane protein, heavy metal efflux system